MNPTEKTTCDYDKEPETETIVGKLLHISKKTDDLGKVELDLSKYNKTEVRKRVVAHVSTKR